LPGPRNRDGLPESIAFWKQRIEETDPDNTFNVGLIYGPSGCGKSSLVKAGLLPHLSADVAAVYVEATPDETETRILRGLRKRLPDVPEDLTLVETFMWLRRETTQHVVVIIDQFEQWLHAHREDRESELVAALRQCDGGRLQAVVMVRDDFAMAAARFMDLVDVPIVQGNNFATVDLFDVEHAEKVLVKFGQAFGKLPAKSGKLTDDEQACVQSVASGLAQDAKVVSVRLALFSEMVKGKPWVPATLDEVGGTAGIGVNFLEETFSSRIANPKHRLHQQAAREVLKALLPEVGSDIKGHMRSHSELLQASGYQNRPREFDDLLRILDGELRLITPTDPEGAQTASASDLDSKYYQLTHDYLIPSLREWLTRKQQETRKGRAELKLAERSALWQAKRENRYLPSALEWARIRFLTYRSKWTASEKEMMREAGRRHIKFWGGAAVVVLLIGIAIQSYVEDVRARANGDRVRSAVGALGSVFGVGIPPSLLLLDTLPARLVSPELQRQWMESSGQQQLSLAYGLAHFGDVRVDAIVEALLDPSTKAEEMSNVVAALMSERKAAIKALRTNAARLTASQDWTLKARCAIAALHLGDDKIAVEMLQAFPEGPRDTLLLVRQEAIETRLHRVDVLPESQREADDYYALAQRLYYLNRPAEVLQPTEWLIKNGVETDGVLQLRLFSLARTGQERTARETLARLRSQSPNQDLCAHTEILLQGFLGHLDEAIEQLERYLAHNSDRPRAIYDAARTASQLTLASHLHDDSKTAGLRQKAVELLKRLDNYPATRVADSLLHDLDFMPLRDEPIFTEFMSQRFATHSKWDRTPRTVFIAECEHWAGNIRNLCFAATEAPLEVRSGICLAVVRASKQQSLAADDRKDVLELLSSWNIEATDGGTYSASRWAVRQLMHDTPPEAVNRPHQADFVRHLPEGLTMLRVPGGIVGISRDRVHPHWISDTEVTVGAFQQFIDSVRLKGAETGWPGHRFGKPTGRETPEWPALEVTWFDCVRFCNWLSERHNLPLCYEIKPDGSAPSGFRVEWIRERDGFRLPTASEWGHDCSAMATTVYAFGDDEAFVDLFAAHLGNSTGPAGRVRRYMCNAWGLFDMHGNAAEWAWDSASPVDPRLAHFG
jgi:tetratricopeptide (TPR) repeat protein/energy-coupling factor transporter ATP-binding protein EcfA2